MNKPRQLDSVDTARLSPWFVWSWMSKDVFTVEPEDILVDAFELMRIHRIRHIPVVKDGKLVGILSDRDIRHALPMRVREGDAHPAYGETLLNTPVATVMTTNPITIDPNATIREAAEIICREKIGALPVMDQDKLVGIISSEDLLWAFLDNTAGLPE